MSKKTPLKKNRGAKLSQRFFGKRELTFGKHEKKKHSLFRNVITVVLATLMCVALAAGAIYWGINRVGRTNSAEALLGEDFDPIQDYDSVLRVGTLGQKVTLLGALESAPVLYANPPVQLDRLGKISDVARLILEDDSLEESQRIRATQSRIRALWNLYYVKLVNKLESKQTTQKFFEFVRVHLDDSSESIAKAAKIAYMRGLAGETITKKFEEKLQDFENAVVDLIKTYPDDSEVISNIRVVFTQLRAANSEKAIKLAQQVTDLAGQSNSDEGKELARFLDDIIVLYENGIGDLSKVVDIIDDVKEFQSKMIELANSYQCGETVLTQLDNGVEFLERRRENQLAQELSQKIFESSNHRTDENSQELAFRIGREGVARNQLPNRRWDFTETDLEGKPIEAERFADNVCLIVFFSSEQRQATSILRAVSSLSQALAGRNVQFIFVEVAEKSSAQYQLANSKNLRSPILLTSHESPNNYLKQCPTKRLPYLLLIDKNGIVDSINISLSVVMTRIEYLLSENQD